MDQNSISEKELKNTELFEKSNIWKVIAKLAIPTVISQIILVIYNMADTFFVGLSHSDFKISAVAICMPAFMILSAIANLFGIGGASVISRALGKNKFEKARNTASFSFWSCLFFSLLYCVTVYFARDFVLDLLGGKDPLIHQFASTYITWSVVFGGVATVFNSFFSHLIRSEGKAFNAGLGVVLGGVLNIALDPLFMFVILEPGQEVLGAAIATFLSNVLATIYFIVVLIVNRKKSVISFKICKGMFSKSIVMGVILTGLPAFVMTLFENISYGVLDNLMATYGVVQQAGIGVAKKINMLAHSIVRGMSQGVLPLIAYNYSKKNLKRMNSALYISAAISTGIALVCMVVYLIFAKPLVSVFLQGGTESVQYGVAFLKILCLGAPFSACAYALISFFQATKRSMRSFLLAILRKGLFDIPLMFILNTFIPVYGIVWATPIADIVCAVVAVCMYLAFKKEMFNKYGKRGEQLQTPIVKSDT